LSSNLVQTLKTQLASQLARQADLQTTLGARHPEIIASNAQISAISQSLAAAVNSFSDQARLTLRSTRSAEAKLERAAAAQRIRVLEIRELRDQAEALHLELNSAQAVFRQALDGYDKVMLGAAGHYSNVSLVSSANAPYRPSKPNLIKFFLMAMVLGMGAGIGIPLLYELLRRRVRCRDDLERDHGIPVLIELGPLDPKTFMTPVRSNS
jgi:succinoglycan biosynthesis transport protein ExoP